MIQCVIQKIIYQAKLKLGQQSPRVKIHPLLGASQLQHRIRSPTLLIASAPSTTVFYFLADLSGRGAENIFGLLKYKYQF